jgi:hypothetical protein
MPTSTFPAGSQSRDTRQKALALNLDGSRYGTFAEIGAGQEVVRWFFRAGGAAGTVAKSISAYDMAVSDAIYGQGRRYVCRERLQSMLDYEHRLNLERLGPARGSSTAFFAFADTVSAKSYRECSECHGWMGVKFQARPGAGDSQIIIHVRMLDSENALQQEALGIVGVNLLHGACQMNDDAEQILDSLLDGLSTNRIEIDMIEFSGEAFEAVDNRVMSLTLVQRGLTGAAMFGADGDVLQPSEVLYKKAVVIERGSFRPVTHPHLDMLRCAQQQFGRGLPEAKPEANPLRVIELMEITMRHLRGDEVSAIDYADFLARADVLAAAGKTVLISDYSHYHSLATYLSRCTPMPVAIVLGAGRLLELFDENRYADLPGGILESFGRLFKNDTRLYVYPRWIREGGPLQSVSNLEVPKDLVKLYGHLVDRGFIVQLEDHDPACLRFSARAVLKQIEVGDAAWERAVPEPIAEVIRRRGFFGHRSGDSIGPG